MEKGFISDLARRLAASVPGGAAAAGVDLERNFQGLLQAAFARLDLVTREEFDVQRKVLARSREKLDALEQQLLHLEASPGDDAGPVSS